MNLILLGAPGSGKGTQGVRIAAQYNIPHISTGDIFRKNLKEGTPIGLKAKEYIDKGQLVPDSVVVEIVKQRLEQKDCNNGYLLDGFPRTVFQAEELSKFAKIDKVINISVDLTKLMKRLVGRRVCNKCGESYHITTYSENSCGKCGGDVIHRDDDKEETVNKRLNVYIKETAPLIEFYSAVGNLVTVDGMNPIEEVFRDIQSMLDK